MFADLLVETNRRQTALAVPKEAVVDEGGEVVVYLQRGGETFERRRVEVGIRDAEPGGNPQRAGGGRPGGDQGSLHDPAVHLSSAIPAHGHAH